MALTSKTNDMNREIKFRAWDGKRMTTSGIMYNNSTGCIERPKVQSFYIMQFTGLHDKNGKEIYEGDILECDLYRVEIQFKGGQFVGLNKHYSFTEIQNRNWLQWEVIGNIHEHSHLLND